MIWIVLYLDDFPTIKETTVQIASVFIIESDANRFAEIQNQRCQPPGRSNPNRFWVEGHKTEGQLPGWMQNIKPKELVK